MRPSSHPLLGLSAADRPSLDKKGGCLHDLLVSFRTEIQPRNSRFPGWDPLALPATHDIVIDGRFH